MVETGIVQALRMLRRLDFLRQMLAAFPRLSLRPQSDRLRRNNYRSNGQANRRSPSGPRRTRFARFRSNENANDLGWDNQHLERLPDDLRRRAISVQRVLH